LSRTRALALNTWYFVALTYDNATHLMTLYKDGSSGGFGAGRGDQFVTDPTISIGSVWRIQRVHVKAALTTLGYGIGTQRRQILSLTPVGYNVIGVDGDVVGETGLPA